MFNEVTRNTLAPLVLRLALAAVLIYHGLAKVAPKNDWGAAWATNYWASLNTMPPSLPEKVDELSGFDDKEKAEIKTKLNVMYNRAQGEATLPESLRVHAAQLAVAWGELIGGVALLLGLLTRLAALGIAVIQVGAIVTVTAYRGFLPADLSKVGAEYNVALIAMCLALMITGGGLWSIDHRLRSRQKAPKVEQKVPVTV
jgi:uncharacterized membrane protein YphA (DoxX/SURF4 family)